MGQIGRALGKRIRSAQHPDAGNESKGFAEPALRYSEHLSGIETILECCPVFG